jgi:hypothetical protein
MKKLILFCFVFSPLLITAQRSSGKYFIYVQGGYLSSGYVKEALQKSIATETDLDNHKCIILNAGFQIKISKDWRIGPSFTYDHFGTKHRDVEFHSFSYLLRTDRVWKETKQATFYSGICLGINSIRRIKEEIKKDYSVNPCWHIYLIGADIKIYKLLLDVNAGYGVSGVLNVGAKYPF